LLFPCDLCALCGSKKFKTKIFTTGDTGFTGEKRTGAKELAARGVVAAEHRKAVQ